MGASRSLGTLEAMHDPITKAVIPAAGLGTRFLPATKALPKEMLPVVDTPAIQYVVEEAVAAGLEDVLMITGRNKNALENHFDRATELEATLRAKGDAHRLSHVERATALAQIHYVRQGDPLGLGHAVLRARRHVGSQAFAVLLGDDLIHQDETLLQRMLEAHRTTGASVLALMEVDPSQTHLYGIATVEEGEGDLRNVRGLVEKPKPGDAPSNLAVIGRYVLRPEVFDVLEQTEPGVGGEIQLTDALRDLATMPSAGGLVGVVFQGRRFDTGDRLSYLKATIELALEREDLGADLDAWLHELMAARR